MKRVLLTAVVLALALPGVAGASDWHTVRFAAGSGEWASPQAVAHTVSVDVRRAGRFLPWWYHADPCSMTFHDAKVQATFSNCSRRLRLSYVALDAFALRYRVKRD